MVRISTGELAYQIAAQLEMSVGREQCIPQCSVINRERELSWIITAVITLGGCCQNCSTKHKKNLPKIGYLPFVICVNLFSPAGILLYRPNLSVLICQFGFIFVAEELKHLDKNSGVRFLGLRFLGPDSKAKTVSFCLKYTLEIFQYLYCSQHARGKR